MPPQTALIVDDSKLARITLQRLLEKRNFQVKMAESGIQALELLKQELPDIIFMDHLMPEMDGFEAMREIKANPATRHIPVVMCTGKEGADNYDAEAKSHGASATLSKPPELEQLNLVLAETQSKPDVSVAVAAESPVSTEQIAPPIDLDTFERKLFAAFQEALDTLRMELIDTRLPEFEQRQSIQQSELSQTLDRQIADIRAAILTDDQVRAVATDVLASQPAAAPSLPVDEIRQEFRVELDQHAQKLGAEIGNLKEQIEQQAAQSPSQPDTAWQDATLALERQLAEVRAELNQARTDFDQRLDQVSLQTDSTSAAPTDNEIRQDLERQIAGLEQHLSQQIRDLQANLESQAQAVPQEDDSLWRGMLETDVAELRERLGLELTELRGEIARGAGTYDTYQDYSVMEARATEAAVAAVEETLDALLAHKVEQIRNSLMLEFKAQARAPAKAEETAAAAPQANAEEVRRMAHEAVSEELDHASEHLVSRITEALRQQVEDTQQELMTRQEMFEQERNALRKQIRSMKNSLLLISGGAGLLAVIAFVTTLMT